MPKTTICPKPFYTFYMLGKKDRLEPHLTFSFYSEMRKRKNFKMIERYLDEDGVEQRLESHELNSITHKAFLDEILYEVHISTDGKESEAPDFYPKSTVIKLFKKWPESFLGSYWIYPDGTVKTMSLKNMRTFNSEVQNELKKESALT